jgi:hypothetical protein
MIRRETWIALMILAGLAGAVWYLNRPQTVQPDEITPAPPTQFLFDVLGGEYTRVELTSSEGTAVILEAGEGGAWFVVEESPRLADIYYVQTALIQLNSIRILSTLNPAPEADVLGLEPPRYTLTLDAPAEQRRVEIGNRTATGSGYYVRTASGAIHIAASYPLDDILRLLAFPPYAEVPEP